MSQAERPHRGKSARRQVMAERARKSAAEGNGRSSLTKEDWLQAALEVLNESGVDNVKVLPLSKRLGVTRGSFYWHFEDRDELLADMLDYWEEELTDSVIKHANEVGGTPRRQLEDVLTNVLLNQRNLYDTAIAAWSMFDGRALKAYDRVLRKRVRFVSSLLRQAGIDKVTAEFRTRMLLGFADLSRSSRANPTKATLLKEVQSLCDMAFA